jgi:hypothetical protein
MTYTDMCKYIFKEEGFPDWRWARLDRSRTAEIKTARQICVYLGSIFYNGMTLNQLGEPFGQKHCNVIHSIKVINNLRETEKVFDTRIANYIEAVSKWIDGNIVTTRVKKEKELASMLLAKIAEMELIAKVYCVLSDKKMVDL